MNSKSKAIKKKVVTKAKKIPFLTTDKYFLFSGGWASNWARAPFVMDDVKYVTTEQAMMAMKAKLFGDETKYREILAESSPFKQKQLGRKVADFDAAVWDKHAKDYVTKANLCKYEQNADLRQLLLATGDRTIVEASPKDCKWGVGRAVDDPRAQDPTKWRGQNWLGQVLMDVRSKLRASV